MALPPVLAGACGCRPLGPGIGAVSWRAVTTPVCTGGAEGAGGTGAVVRSLGCESVQLLRGQQTYILLFFGLYTLEEFCKENNKNYKYKIRYKHE